MSKLLLSPSAARQRFLRLLGTAAGFALALAAPAAVQAQAQTVYGLGYATNTNAGFPVGTQLLSTLNVATSSIAGFTPITGVTTGQTLVGLDSRPATGELFALGYDATLPGNNSRLYTLNPSGGVATPVGNAFRLELGGATDRIGFDFNPTVDRIRVVGSYNPTTGNTNNYRLNPTPDGGGAIAIIKDGVLAYATGTPADPNIGAAAYTNSAFGASTTVLYDIDETAGLLTQQNPPNPNNGMLVTQVPITFNGDPFGTKNAIDIDIYTNPNTGAQSAYLIEVTTGGSTNFYNFNLATGEATSTGSANVVPAVVGVELRDIAAAIAPRSVPALVGQLAYAVTTNNNLISFDIQNPSMIRSLVAITGLGASQTLVGTDFRPNTGQLFGLGYDPISGVNNDRLYTINLTTGVATPVGTADIDLPLGTDLTAIGFDFNPTVDRIRVVSANRANYRLNPNDGTVAFLDGTLTYGPGDPNVSQTPTVGSGAYTNSFVGSAATGLYVLDHVLGTVSFQNPPNVGTLTNSRPLTGVNGVGVGGAIGAVNDLEVYFNGTSDTPYLAAVPNGQVNSRLYSLSAFSPTNTGAQVATDLGPIGGATSVRDISILLAPNSTPTAAAALTGQLLYAVASGNLISFDSGNPGVIRTAVNITGLPVDGSQVLAGADFRPLDGSLFALGYNAATQQGQLYSLNSSTGALTAVGALQAMALGTTASAIGFDFNPTVDLIRLVSATNQANLRISPLTGVIQVDTNLTNPDNGTAPAIAGAAYTNNDNDGNTGTTLYGYDQTANVLVRATVAAGASAGTNAANAGTYRNVGTSSGISVEPGVDFDIYSDLTNAANPTNTGFIVAAPTGTTADNLYTIDLTSGAASVGVRIGNGSQLTALAAFLTPGPVVAAALTWTGSVSTDWFTAGNWTTNQVPTAGIDAIIPASLPNMPFISFGTANVRNLTLNAGAVLTQTGGTLLLAANLTNNGTYASIGGTVSLGTTTLASILGSSSTRFFNLTAGTNGAQLSTSASTSVQRLLTLTGSLTTNGNPLMLESNVTNTALVVNNGSATVNGNVTVQRYLDPSLNAGQGYHHYSAPVSNATVASLTTASFTPVVNPAYNTSATPASEQPFPTVYGYDQDRLTTTSNNLLAFDKGWFSPATTGDALVVGQGYTVNTVAGQTLAVTGALNNGTIALALASNRATQPDGGWQLVGNPYPGPLDYSRVVAADRAGLDAAIYMYQSTSQYGGQYRSFVAGVGNPVVPQGQGFFTRVAAGQPSGTLTLRNTCRLTLPNNTPVLRTAGARPLVQLTLQGAGSPLSDEAFVYFENGATESFDTEYDAVKLPNPNGLNLSTSAMGQQFSIDGRSELGLVQRVIPLAIGVPTPGTYSLTTAQLLNLDTTPVYLRDLQLGTLTDLRLTPSYQFTVSNASAMLTNRFELVFSPQQVLATVPAALAQQVAVYPNPATSAVTIELPVALGHAAVVATLVDAVGRPVRTLTLPAQGVAAHQLNLHSLAPGIYALRLSTSAGVIVKKLVVE